MFLKKATFLKTGVYIYIYIYIIQLSPEGEVNKYWWIYTETRSYDGAETCELVGSFLLSQLQDLNINVGPYRDDGLAITNATPRDTENIKLSLIHI